MVPYNVVKTSRMVRLTSITMSMYSSENMMTAWLQGDSKIYISIYRDIQGVSKKRVK